jgi:hypothetical protein
MTDPHDSHDSVDDDEGTICSWSVSVDMQEMLATLEQWGLEEDDLTPTQCAAFDYSIEFIACIKKQREADGEPFTMADLQTALPTLRNVAMAIQTILACHTIDHLHSEDQ